MCYVPARPAAVRQHQRMGRSATRTSCRGCVGVGRRARSVQCSVRDVASRRDARAEGGARGRCRRPHLRHRRVVRGELVAILCVLARRLPAPIRADSVGGPAPSLWAAQRYPSLFVTVWSAPPTSSATADLVQPLHAAMCSAVFLPDGARRNRRSRRPTTSPDGPRGKGAPVAAALGVQVGARGDEPRDDRVMAVVRRPHHGGVPIPAARRGMAAGVSPDQRIPLAFGTRSKPIPVHVGMAGGPGGQPHWLFFLNSGDAD